MPKKKKRSLSRLIEREVVPGSDTVDPDLLSFVASFMEDCSKISTMSNISLLTAESAKKALVEIEARHADLENRLRTGRALQRALLDAKYKGS